MINKEEAKIEAWLAIAKLMGEDYFRQHFEGSCQAYPPTDVDEPLYEYFLGFEGDEKSGLWLVYALVLVDRETLQVQFLDYKTPDGIRMKNPPKPISFT